MTKYFILLLSMAVYGSSLGQTSQVIVNLKSGTTHAFIRSIGIEGYRTSDIKTISKDLEILLLPNDAAIQAAIRKSPYVESYGLDAEATVRTTPNDERFASQWGLKLMDMEQAWDVTTGGKFDGKHDIVIAVLDDGFDVTHEDLLTNFYKNKDEIPDNGVDDDGNGYVDDYLGLNIETGRDDHPLDDHGTAVAGIVGAEGNNGTGVSGVMWDVKILPISEVTRQSELIESFQYIVDLRRKWNDSNGEQGAFIVATNYSAGIDNAFGSDPQYKSWCDMYDLLGSVGILNTGATANNNIDVDVAGDMPTTCPSEYLIAVTNVIAQDVLAENAAYGVTNIDLAAPGGTETAPMLALDINSTYGPFNGTSGATPHVAGTIGLLYSVSCSALTSLVYDSPSAAAQYVRDAIFAGVVPNASLQGKTVTGGRLNANNSVQFLSDLCQGTDMTDITNIIVNTGSISVTYNTVDEAAYYLSITDTEGRRVHDELVANSGAGIQTVELDNLQLRAGIYYFTIYNDKSISTKTLRISK